MGDDQGRDQGSGAAADRLAFFEQVIDHLPIAIAVLSPDGTFEYINATGIPDPVMRQQMVGRPLGDLNPAYVRDPAVIAERHRQMLRVVHEGERIEFEERLTLPSGAHQVIHHTLIPMRDATGAVTRVMAAAIDRTAQHDAEDRLRHAQKMEVAGRLAGGVSHDFNNLLTVIRGITDLLREELRDEHRHAADAIAMINEVQMAVRRGHDLTRQLLAFSRPGDREPIAFAVDDAVQATSRLVRRLLPERIRLEILADASGAWVCMDPGALDQVLLNLAANARDAMAAEGRVQIRTCIEVASPLATRVAQPCVHLTVSDTGNGMSDAVRQRVFEPFFTTKAIGAGTGLGLATVRTLVEQAGGWVAVDSEEQVGTTVHCWIPIIDAPASSVVDAPPPPPAGAAMTRRILLVEDEDGVRRVVHRLLTRAGYQVEEARYGEEAIALVADDLSRFDLVLTDVYMPGMNGVRLVEQLRTRRPELPVLFMSGHIDDPLLEERLRAEQAVVIDKPFTADDLLARIQQVFVDPSDTPSPI